MAASKRGEGKDGGAEDESARSPTATSANAGRERHDRPPDASLLGLAGLARANSYLASALLHEINAPLNNFKLTLALFDASMARRGETADPALDARWQRYLKVLHDESGRLADLLQEVRRMCEIAAPHVERFDLRDIVAELARLLRHEATVREIEIVRDVPDAPMVVDADRARVRLAALGLVIHSLENSAPRARVSIVLRRLETPDALLEVASSSALRTEELLQALAADATGPRLEHVGVIAARALLEADRGRLETLRVGDGSAAFRAVLPLVV
jgi:signal transduction histidine kinase